MTAMSLEIPGLDVSRETLEKLAAYEALVQKWTPKINLIARNSVPDIWERHIRDSAQIVLAAPSKWTRWIDLGSGGGFPGIVVGVFSAGDQNVTLVESDARKSAFLRTVIRELDLPCHVITDRIEEVNETGYDVVSARALAPLPQLVAYANKLLSPKGTALFPKGRGHAQEVTAATADWAFDIEAVQSMTDPDARILRLKEIAPRGL